jgi:uncharacterized protein with NAD-binding domain and iron-sulfur cluster
MAHREIERALPTARGARLVRHRVIKEKRATFAGTIGIDELRPATTGSVDNLLLAGDWTDTGWPATMEGAVRSGYQAARAVLLRLDRREASGGAREEGAWKRQAELLVPDLPASTLYRWLSR